MRTPWISLAFNELALRRLPDFRLGRNILPLELGGTLPLKAMADLWWQELSSKAHKLSALDSLYVVRGLKFSCLASFKVAS